MLSLLLIASAPIAPAFAAPQTPRIGRDLQARLDAARSNEPIPVQVMLRADDLPGSVARRRAPIRARQDRALGALQPGSFDLRRRYESVSGLALWARPSAIAALERHPEVERVYLDRPLRTAMVEGAALLGSDQVVAMGTTGAGINVAVLDTGIDTDHPRLVDDLVAEQCFCDDAPAPDTGCCPLGGETESGAGSAEDDVGHGTGMSGVITSSRPGRMGIAPDAGIVAVRVLSTTGSGNTSDLDAGLDWVLMNHVAHGIRVVNMSLSDGGEFDDDSVDPCTGSMTQTLISDLVNAGVVVFAASGNNGHDAGISFPACIPDVISVGAYYDAYVQTGTWCLNPPTCSQSCTDMPGLEGSFTCFTNDGSLLDVLAPSWVARTLGLGGTNQNLGGTSVASAYASGEAALLLSLDPTLDSASIRTLLTTHASSVTNPDNSTSYPATNLFDAYVAQSDQDLDGILADGDGSGTIGDATCTNGQVAGCDDNCLGVSNPLQEDGDNDGVGDACDVVLVRAPALGGASTGGLVGALIGVGFALLRLRHRRGAAA